MTTLRLGLLVMMVPAAAQPLAVGKILIATPKSHDPDLARSVVLLIHSDKDGAIGLILNRPVKDVYFGGPVALGARCLFRCTAKPEGAEHLFADVYLANKPVPKGRVYAGYVGWSGVQLKDEISLGLWKTRDPDAAIVFDANPATLWSRLLR
jgi:putative transcriptional regulator